MALTDRTLGELLSIRALLVSIAKILEDEDAPAAKAEYERQLATVDAEIQRRAQPEPVVVKMAPARMTGK